jgi:hypothetical protein
MPRYSTRSRTYRRESDDGSKGSIDWDAVKRGEEAQNNPSEPQNERRSARGGSVEWYDSGESSHDSEFYIPPGGPLEQTYGRIPIQGMLDHLSRMASRTYESTHSIDFAFLHRIGVREEFFRLTSRVGFTIPFWTIHDSCPAYDSATIEFLSSLRLMEDGRRGRYIKFRIGGATHRVTLEQLRAWFHLHPSPQVDEPTYRGDMTREDFFMMSPPTGG